MVSEFAKFVVVADDTIHAKQLTDHLVEDVTMAKKKAAKKAAPKAAPKKAPAKKAAPKKAAKKGK